MVNIINFIKNKYFRTIVIFLVILSIFFAINSLFSNSRFNELKNKELNQYEYIPTLNGQCIYETKEIATWVKKTTIDTSEIILNPEIGLFDFKCLGKVSGSSLVQNYKIDSNIKNIDLVVYPTFLLSHLLIVLFIISIRKKSISIDKDYVTFLLASSLLINLFSSVQIFFDSYSWIFLMLITAFIEKLSSDNKYLLMFVVFLYAINPLNIFLVVYLFFLYMAIDLKILKKIDTIKVDSKILKKIDTKTAFYFLVSIFIFLLWNYDLKYGFNPTDEARVFGYIQRISNGDIPHKDFIFPHLSGTAYLYYFFNYLEYNTIFLQRFLGVINLMTYSYLILILTGKIFTKQNLLIRFLLLIFSFYINMHYFFTTIWPTTDGILLSLIACFIIHNREKYKYLGFIILGLVPLLKSGFLFSTIILFFYFTLKIKFNVNKFIKSGLSFAVFPLSYLFLVIYNGGFNELWTQLFKMPKLWSLWISSLGINNLTLILFTFITCLPFFFIHKKSRYLDMRVLIIFSLLYLVSIESFLEIGPKPRYFLYSLFVFIAIFLVKNKMPTLNQFELPLLLCLTLGFSSTLSAGWAVSHWVSGSLIAICILLVFHLFSDSNLEFERFFTSSITKLFLIILIFYSPVIENFETRSNYNYRDVGQNSILTFNLNDINKYYGNIYTSENTYNYLSSIDECISLIDSKNISVYPDNPFIYLMYDLNNPLLIDRFEGYFVGSEYVNLRLNKNIDKLNSQSNVEFAVLIQTYPAMNIVNIDKEKINLVNNRNDSGFWEDGLRNINFIKDNLRGDLSSCNSFEIISKNINYIDR